MLLSIFPANKSSQPSTRARWSFKAKTAVHNFISFHWTIDRQEGKATIAVLYFALVIANFFL